MSPLDHPDAQALLADAVLTPEAVRGCRDRLTRFLERYLPRFYRAEQRANAALVIRGLLSGLQRKTCEPIAVEAVKTELGVSKQPVMEALRRLSADGLVEIRPQVGCRVPTYTSEEVADFFMIFAGVDSEATAIAARRATAEQLAELVAINDEIGALRDSSDASERLHGYRMLNRQFHGVILTMTHSTMVDRTVSRLWDMSDMLINSTGISHTMADELSARHADHEEMIAAIRRGDPRAARRHARTHILRNASVSDITSVRVAEPGGA